MLITFILTAAMWAAFGALVVAFFKAFMNFFDLLVKQMKKWVKAIKVMVKKRNSNEVEGKVLGIDKDGNITSVGNKTEIGTVSWDEIKKDKNLVDAFKEAEYINHGGEQVQMIKVNDEQIRELIA